MNDVTSHQQTPLLYFRVSTKIKYQAHRHFFDSRKKIPPLKNLQIKNLIKKHRGGRHNRSMHNHLERRKKESFIYFFQTIK